MKRKCTWVFIFLLSWMFIAPVCTNITSYSMFLSILYFIRVNQDVSFYITPYARLVYKIVLNAVLSLGNTFSTNYLFSTKPIYSYMRVCLSHRVNMLINLHFGFNCNSQSNAALSVLALMGVFVVMWTLVPTNMEQGSISSGIRFQISRNALPR